MRDQNNWRCCQKCHVMFFDGFSEKGNYPADGSGDLAVWLNFILPLRAQSEAFQHLFL